MTVTCPYCKKKFHKGKTNEFGRLSRHIWKDHGDKHRAKIRKGQRDSRKQLMSELEYTDDMILQSLIDAGINISPPRQQSLQPQYYAPPPYPTQPTEHESLTGALITAVKVGMQISKAVKTSTTTKRTRNVKTFNNS